MDGNKVQKKVTENRQTQTTDYLGRFQYLDGKLDFLPHAEGYVKAVHTGETTEYHYVYNYTDHLGNIRLSYGRDPETNEIAILKESHYYPFGLQHRGYVGDHRVFEQVLPIGRVNLIPVRNYLDDSYRYTFGGKEEQPELGLNWIDHHARNYDAALGRWMSPDPLADVAPDLTPYRYGFNNPMRYTDPTGMFELDPETARKYPKLAQYLQGLMNVWENKSDDFKQTFYELSGLNASEVTNMLTYGQGPKLEVRNLDREVITNDNETVIKKSNGRTYALRNVETNEYKNDNNEKGRIALDVTIVESYINVANRLEHDIGEILIESTTFHEAVHFGRFKTGKSRRISQDAGSSLEPGKEFEKRVYGLDIGRSSAEGYIRKKQKIHNIKPKTINTNPLKYLSK